MEHIPQSELSAQFVELVQRYPGPDEVAYRLARFVEARLLVQENQEMNRLRARLSKLEAQLKERTHE